MPNVLVNALQPIWDVLFPYHSMQNAYIAGTLVALIAGIDRILDMARTTVNVSGDILVSVLIARSEKELDLATYNDAHAGDDIDFTLR